MCLFHSALIAICTVPNCGFKIDVVLSPSVRISLARSPLRRCARHAEFSRKSWRMVLSVHVPSAQNLSCTRPSDLTLFFSQLYWYRYRTQFSTVLYWNSARYENWDHWDEPTVFGNSPRYSQSLGHSCCTVFTVRARKCIVQKRDFRKSRMVAPP